MLVRLPVLPRKRETAEERRFHNWARSYSLDRMVHCAHFSGHPAVGGVGHLMRRQLGDNPLDAAMAWLIIFAIVMPILTILAVTVKPCWLVVPCS